MKDQIVAYVHKANRSGLTFRLQLAALLGQFLPNLFPEHFPNGFSQAMFGLFMLTSSFVWFEKDVIVAGGMLASAVIAEAAYVILLIAPEWAYLQFLYIFSSMLAILSCGKAIYSGLKK